MLPTGRDDAMVLDALDDLRLRPSLITADTYDWFDRTSRSGGPPRAISLRIALAVDAAGLSGDLRGAVDAVIGRSRSARRSRLHDPILPGEQAQIDCAQVRVWTGAGRPALRIAAHQLS